MSVYEATKPAHYVKIAKFIEEEMPTELEKFLPFTCWQRGFKGKGHLTDFIKKLKEQTPALHIFWVEDEDKEIRAVLSVHERMTYTKVPVATYAFVFMNRKDWEANEGRYFKELLDNIIRNEAPKYKLEKGDFFGLQKYAEWTKELCGDTMTIKKEHDTDLGKVYRYEIDFLAYQKKV